MTHLADTSFGQVTGSGAAELGVTKTPTTTWAPTTTAPSGRGSSY